MSCCAGAGSTACGKGLDARSYLQRYPDYYPAFMLDPDGNNIEVVHHGPTRRSARSVEMEPGGA